MIDVGQEPLDFVAVFEMAWCRIFPLEVPALITEEKARGQFCVSVPWESGLLRPFTVHEHQEDSGLVCLWRLTTEH